MPNGSTTAPPIRIIRQSLNIQVSYRTALYAWLNQLTSSAASVVHQPIRIVQGPDDMEHWLYGYGRIIYATPYWKRLLWPVDAFSLFRIQDELSYGSIGYYVRATLFEPRLHEILQEALPHLIAKGPVTFDIHLCNALNHHDYSQSTYPDS